MAPCAAVSFKVLNAITPSLPRRSMEKFSPLMKKIGPDHDAVGLTSGNISSTLEKLCMWEKKLYNEVKVRNWLPNAKSTLLLSEFVMQCEVRISFEIFLFMPLISGCS